MKTFSKNEELTFTKNFTTILACTKLCALDKLIIARVLNWQQSNLTCTLSNNALAKELGISVKTLNGAITRLNKTNFFVSKETSDFNEYDKWSNSKEMKIDEELLFDFVSTNVTPKKQKKKSESKPQDEKSETPDSTEAETISEPAPIQSNKSEVIFLNEKDKGDVKKIEDFDIELPEPTNIKFVFDDGEIFDSTAFEINGKYYLVDEFNKQKSFAEIEEIIIEEIK